MKLLSILIFALSLAYGKSLMIISICLITSQLETFQRLDLDATWAVETNYLIELASLG